MAVLTVLQDNVYTHEVTLHELNVIHDGSDLDGPLRLRLRVIAPRFVTRYNTLRDQIARLNVGADEEGAYHDTVSSDPHYGEGTSKITLIVRFVLIDFCSRARGCGQRPSGRRV